MWLLQSTPAEVCADLAGRSNSTATFSGTIGSLSCGSPPPGVAALSTLTLNLLPYEVTLEAWSSAGG